MTSRSCFCVAPLDGVIKLSLIILMDDYAKQDARINHKARRRSSIIQALRCNLHQKSSLRRQCGVSSKLRASMCSACRPQVLTSPDNTPAVTNWSQLCSAYTNHVFTLAKPTANVFATTDGRTFFFYFPTGCVAL